MGNRGWKKRWSEGKRRLYCVLGSSAGCWALNSILKDLGTSDMPLSRSGEKILNWADPALDRSRRLGQGNLPWSDASSNSLKSTKTATLLQVVARATPQFWKNLLPSTSKLGIGTKYRSLEIAIGNLRGLVYVYQFDVPGKLLLIGDQIPRFPNLYTSLLRLKVRELPLSQMEQLLQWRTSRRTRVWLHIA